MADRTRCGACGGTREHKPGCSIVEALFKIAQVLGATRLGRPEDSAINHAATEARLLHELARTTSFPAASLELLFKARLIRAMHRDGEAKEAGGKGELSPRDLGTCTRPRDGGPGGLCGQPGAGVATITEGGIKAARVLCSECSAEWERDGWIVTRPEPAAEPAAGTGGAP